MASKFLSKSKWGKVFKENDSPSQQTASPAFQLNDDVVDFLKPSTQKSTRPKIDIALAQRWPDSHQVHQLSESATPSPRWTGYRKPRRREGLVVGFAKTAPEVIGEGGDDALDPPREISRKRAAMARSVSDRKPAPLDNGMAWPGTAPRVPLGQETDNGGDTRPAPIRRAGTSHQEMSAPLERKHASPPSADVTPHKPSLTRVPTGLSTEPVDIDAHLASPEESDIPAPRVRPTIDTQSNNLLVTPDSGLPSASPLSPVVLRRKDMQESEGMAFRRASAMFNFNNDDEDENEASPAAAPTDGQALSPPSGDNGDPKLITTPSFSAALIQERSKSSTSPVEPSPFADPKYLKHRPQEQQRIPALPPSEMSSASFAPTSPPYQAGEPRLAPTQLEASTRTVSNAPSSAWKPDPPSYMRSTPVSQAPPRGEPYDSAGSTHESPNDYVPSYMRGAQTRPDQVMLASPPPAIASVQPTNLASDNRRIPSHSPMRDQKSQIQTKNINQEHGQPSPPREDHSSYYQRGTGHGPQHRKPVPHSVGAFADNGMRPQSRDQVPPQQTTPASSAWQPGARDKVPYGGRGDPPDDRHQVPTLPPDRSSPAGRERSPADYFGTGKTPQFQAVRPPIPNLSPDAAGRPSSSSSSRSFSRFTPSPQSQTNVEQVRAGALADFAGRVASMHGVFRLIAEKERPGNKTTPQSWLRAGLWWYFRGKAGLEALLQQRQRNPNASRDVLTQAHVDLAKSWWILSDMLRQYDTSTSPGRTQSTGAGPEQLETVVALLRGHIQSLSFSLQRNDLMPPQPSLIQRQDTSIWLEYPRFTDDVVAALSGASAKSVLLQNPIQSVAPLAVLPLGDGPRTHCYSHFFVDVSMTTDDSSSDRVVLPCILTVLRDKRSFRPGIVIASQSELVNLQVNSDEKDPQGLSWQQVVWRSGSCSLGISLRHGFDVIIGMQEPDFRRLWNMVEYARKVEDDLSPQAGEKLVHEVGLAELQVDDSAGSHAFPTDKLRACTASVFERTIEHRSGSGMRRLHRGFRLLISTDPGHRSLSSASYEVCKDSPLLYEFITNAAAQGTAAMVVHIREDRRQCRILLVFADIGARQTFYDVLNSIVTEPDETKVSTTTITDLTVEPALSKSHNSAEAPFTLQSLRWQKLCVMNGLSEGSLTPTTPTVESEHLRIVAQHTCGHVTDWLSLAKGELLLRLPCADSPLPNIQLLREAQEDLTMSVDIRQVSQESTQAISEVMHLARTEATIRTYKFASLTDLHSYQESITGMTVRYDGVASNFGISHRMMVVPIYQKKQVDKVRVQIVSRASITQILCFMEDYSLADALCFQVKSTDTFERVKGDNKHKKWAIKFVDAKFKLPSKLEKGEADPQEFVKRRFVNLEGLEYAEEHDDITVGFDTEQERDRFAQALPAATTVSRGITLKRRI